MNTDQLILVLIWIIAPAAMVLFVRRGTWPQFALAFLLCQSFTWVTVILHVKFGIFSYPVREFPKATEMGFTMQYLLYPTVCGLYQLRKPEGTPLRRILYMLLPWTVGITIFHWLLGEYTGLLEYNRSHSVWVWMIITLNFVLVSIISRWFFKDPAAFKTEERIL
jgi:hypothetical protein